MSNYRWNPKAGRYRASNGRFVAMDRIHAALEERMEAAAERMGLASGRLAAGSLDVAGWQAAMAHEVRKIHVAAAALGRGGWAQVSSWDTTSVRIRQELMYLDRFAWQIANGEQPLDGRFAVRASMYAGAGHATLEGERLRQQFEQGAKWQRNILTAIDNCDGCLAATAAGWQPIGTLPPIGSRQCLSACRCEWAISDSVTTPGVDDW